MNGAKSAHPSCLKTSAYSCRTPSEPGIRPSKAEEEVRYIRVSAGDRNGPRILPMVTSIRVAFKVIIIYVRHTESFPFAARVMTTFELIVVGIHPMTISPTRMTVSILSVPDDMIADTSPNTRDENICSQISRLPLVPSTK